ncbi:sodium- and chloride-dependent creatine transporter 1-like [Pecten maximus]|uniref:sodium- and chloride-dependent creatine transporter 1-like n=1 Tax=Pecten maximus TaxID=6579 RepID=UPI0014587499|nr:sodium- and chloride-dependent creatine transporter 1-like [Pecten maximus]
MDCNHSNGAERSGMHKEKQGNTKKEEWGRKLDYILTILGFLVGFGNIWRFPYVCMKNGGGAFLIPYVLTLFFMVAPLYFLEVSLGQFSGKSYRDVWSYCPLIKGMGLGIQIMVLPGLCYYIMLLAWVFNYMYYSFQSPLPWSTCGNEWNTPYCFSFADNKQQQLMTNLSTTYSPNSTGQGLDNYTMQYNISNINDQFMSKVNSSLTNETLGAMKGHSAEEEFWQ